MNFIPSCLLALLVLSACATPPTERESLSFPVDESWKVGHQAEVPGQYVITELVLEDDDIENWRELLTVQNFAAPWGGPAPSHALAEMKQQREKTCPGGTTWKVIESDETSLLYEWQAKPCMGFPDQHEIGRLLYGKYNRFVLRYTVKLASMPVEAREAWIRKLSLAKIEIEREP